MSQSRFSIVLVGVSALLRRPLVSRLRPAEGERSSWVVFAARGCRFDSGFRSAGWRFRLPFRRWPLGELVFGLTASAFRHAPIRTAAPPTRGPTERTDTTLVSLQTLIPTC